MKHKRLISLLLAMIMLLAVPIGVFAADPEQPVTEVTDQDGVTPATYEEPGTTNSDADNYSPTGKDITVKVDETPNAEDGISNKNEMPSGTTYAFKDPVNTDSEGEKDATIIVTYPDKSKDEVTIKVTVKAKPVEKFTVSFDANGGTGSMDKATVEKGKTYTLPSNEFTAPSGKKFKAWEINGKEYAEKATITVEKNTTVKAIWKDKDTTPSTKERLYIIDEYVSGNYVYGYVEDEDDYRVKNATVTAYDRYDDKEIDHDKTDSNGKFKIWIGDRYYRDYDYYYDGYYFDRSDVKYDSNDDPYISTSNGRKWLPSNWSSKSHRSGRRYYDYDIYLIAEKTGYHDSSKVTIYDKYYDDYWHDGKYYNGKYSLTPSIESAYAGEKNVKGSAGDYADITVYDDDGYKLGTATADRDGDFTVYLNRALKYGEKIKVEAKDGSRYSSSTTYTVKYKDSTDVTSFVRPAYIKGYPDGTFKPGATITRAEAVKMFVGLINNGKDVAHSSNTGFSDADNMWYSSVIKYAVDKGYIKGYGDGTFKPNEEITRAEFAAMISKFVDKGYPGSTNFKDIKGHWASDAISALYGNKNIKGYPDGTFKPNSKLTRAEAVTILNSVFGRDTRVNSLYNINTSGLKTFSDVSSGYWAYYEILDASNTHSTSKVGTDGFEVWK